MCVVQFLFFYFCSWFLCLIVLSLFYVFCFIRGVFIFLVCCVDFLLLLFLFFLFFHCVVFSMVAPSVNLFVVTLLGTSFLICWCVVDCFILFLFSYCLLFICLLYVFVFYVFSCFYYVFLIFLHCGIIIVVCMFWWFYGWHHCIRCVNHIMITTLKLWL